MPKALVVQKVHPTPFPPQGDSQIQANPARQGGDGSWAAEAFSPGQFRAGSDRAPEQAVRCAVSKLALMKIPALENHECRATTTASSIVCQSVLNTGVQIRYILSNDTFLTPIDC
jgi:hypothetical protein